MKALYITNTSFMDCIPETHTIGDIIYKEHRIYYTKLDLGKDQIQFNFILQTYKFTMLIANITEEEIPLFMLWRDTYLPGIETKVNVYETRDKDQVLYLLEADTDLETTVYFYKRGDHALEVMSDYW